MGNAFRSKKKDDHPPAQQQQQPANPNAVISEQDRAQLQLKVQKDRLHKYTIQLHTVIEREQTLARQALKEGRKNNALLALKRKRYQETLLERTRGQMLNLEELCSSISFASVQAEVFAALQQGNTVLQALNAQTKLEDVEALMEDTREAVAYQEQVSAALGAELTEQDTEDIDAQIAAWEEEALAKQVDGLPAVPNKAIAAPTEAVAAKPAAAATKARPKEAVLA